jgi:hypothetical protein
MQNTRLFEKSIKDTLLNASTRVEASEQLSSKVKNAVQQQTQKEDPVMKKRFTFKSAMIMAAVLCLTTVTVFAATRASSYISMSSPSARSTTFPTEESLQKDLGFVPKTVKTFSNGYTFHTVEIGGISAIDKDGKKMGDYKSVTYRYAADQGKKVTLNINKQLPDETADSKAVKTDYKGLTLSYTSQKYKFVPVNYKMTEEDKKAEKSGEIMFSYGTDTVENSTIQNVTWINNGISYDLMASDSDLTQTNLTAMAKEIVDKSK